ncbi:hypothetical protein [Streptomyces sp. SID1121]|uniref:hypothetical protein n=1 Tax=Streptomyces sp. SID1121 TaxID=3425888 RepID=UPI004057147D
MSPTDHAKVARTALRALAEQIKAAEDLRDVAELTAAFFGPDRGTADEFTSVLRAVAYHFDARIVEHEETDPAFVQWHRLIDIVDAQIDATEGLNSTAYAFRVLDPQPPTPGTSTARQDQGLDAPPTESTPEASDILDKNTYIYGEAILALTDRLNGTESHAYAAALLHQILDPNDGLLERLGEFFEAAGEKAREAEEDDGFDLSYEFADAAAEIRSVGESLHVAEDRMRALTSPPSTPRPPAAPRNTSGLPAPARPAAPPPGHSR